MRWRFKSWPAEHYSTVTLDLIQKNEFALLKLTQTGIPADEFEKTQEGWKNHYWRSIRQRFGLEFNINYWIASSTWRSVHVDDEILPLC